MKIDLIFNAKPINEIPYKLAHVEKDIKNMLEVGIIYPIEKLECANPMIVQPKKHDPQNLTMCVNFRGLDKVIIIYPFKTSFANEIINEVSNHESYSFTNCFSRYNQVPITKKINKRAHLWQSLDHFLIYLCLLVWKMTLLSSQWQYSKCFESLSTKPWMYTSITGPFIVCLKSHTLTQNDAWKMPTN